MTGLLCPQGGINHSCGETLTLLLLPQFTCTHESSSTLPCRRRENPPSVESVGSLAPLLELKLMLSKSQPLFYTSCQRATHEYVWRGGRSHNLCKVSSCIMQPIYASTGCESTQEYTHTHIHVFTNHTVVLRRGSKQTPKPQVLWIPQPRGPGAQPQAPSSSLFSHLCHT